MHWDYRFPTSSGGRPRTPQLMSTERGLDGSRWCLHWSSFPFFASSVPRWSRIWCLSSAAQIAVQIRQQSYHFAEANARGVQTANGTHLGLTPSASVTSRVQSSSGPILLHGRASLTDMASLSLAKTAILRLKWSSQPDVMRRQPATRSNSYVRSWMPNQAMPGVTISSHSCTPSSIHRVQAAKVGHLLSAVPQPIRTLPNTYEPENCCTTVSLG